jgi:hypothetical protein
MMHAASIVAREPVGAVVSATSRHPFFTRSTDIFSVPLKVSKVSRTDLAI